MKKALMLGFFGLISGLFSTFFYFLYEYNEYLSYKNQDNSFILSGGQEIIRTLLPFIPGLSFGLLIGFGMKYIYKKSDTSIKGFVFGSTIAYLISLICYLGISFVLCEANSSNGFLMCPSVSPFVMHLPSYIASAIGTLILIWSLKSASVTLSKINIFILVILSICFTALEYRYTTNKILPMVNYATDSQSVILRQSWIQFNIFIFWQTGMAISIGFLSSLSNQIQAHFVSERIKSR